MAKKRNRGLLINDEYLRSFIQEYYDGNKARFVGKTDLSIRTIQKACNGGPLDRGTIDRILSADERLSGIKILLVEPDGELNLPKDVGEPQKRPAILSLVSVRGGVGKTMLSVSLAAELAIECRVALVDADLFTFGATRWFESLLQTEDSPLTLLDLATGSERTLTKRRAFSSKVEHLLVDENPGSLLFIPAYASTPNEKKGNSFDIRPTVVDWNLSEAQDAIRRSIDRLSRLGVDVIVLV